ncbi:MAG TPA: hypothetical protein VEW66_00235 [Thermomicrobiales bacterium]|nr:hypothetical protein [Thermomicrobiales bacterium]
MQGVKLVVIWILCVLVGAAVGLGAGWLLWKIGFELIGSAVALVGAAVGGIIAFLWFMNWQDNRNQSKL